MDATLKEKKVKLELTTDINIYKIIEKGIRGGINYTAQRYIKTKNRYMKSYDKDKSSKYIIYLDASNLYGWTMTKYLPTGGFKRLT